GGFADGEAEDGAEEGCAEPDDDAYTFELPQPGHGRGSLRRSDRVSDGDFHTGNDIRAGKSDICEAARTMARAQPRIRRAALLADLLDHLGGQGRGHRL